MSRIIQDSKLTKKSVYESALKQIQDGNELPLYYSVIEFGFFDNYGLKLPPSHTRKYWDKTEVQKTNHHIGNLLREIFNIENLYFFIERHRPRLDQYGEEISKGRFHVNIISSEIKSHTVNKETMNRKVRRLSYENNQYGIAIKDMNFNSEDDYKKELFNTCVRKANWVNIFRPSIHTQLLRESDDLKYTLNYCLKDYFEDKACFTEVIDFDNSDFTKH